MLRGEVASCRPIWGVGRKKPEIFQIRQTTNWPQFSLPPTPSSHLNLSVSNALSPNASHTTPHTPPPLLRTRSPISGCPDLPPNKTPSLLPRSPTQRSLQAWKGQARQGPKTKEKEEPWTLFGTSLWEAEVGFWFCSSQSGLEWFLHVNCG